MNLHEVESSSTNVELTSSTLKLIMEISINKLKNFQNTLQSPHSGPFMNKKNNNNSLLINNFNSRSTTHYESQQISTKNTSSTFSPSNKLYRIMAILKIAKKARSMLLTQQTLNASLIDDQSNDTQNITTSECNPINVKHYDFVKQQYTPHVNTVQMITPSEVLNSHTQKQSERVHKRVYDDSPSDDTTVYSNKSNKRIFDSKLSGWTPEKRLFLNDEIPLHQQNTTNLVSYSTNSHNFVSIEPKSIKTMFNVSDSDEDLQSNDADSEDIITCTESYPSSKYRLPIKNSEVCSLDNNRISSNEVILSSATLQQMNHSVDYDEISSDCGRDMCICLSNSSNSRPLITSII
uniref:Hypotheticial protein n=1 Tax=Schistosoma japonicum TaxID=6182 RepID=C1LDK5_SCHJA|nr:hypotheticial protein [Schistosoma japonicum]